MSGTYAVVMGDRGRLVGPAELRERRNLTPGTPLVLFETPTVEPVVVGDAEAAARLRRRGSGLSLGDRLCLATAQRLRAVVRTADAAWGTADPVRQVR